MNIRDFRRGFEMGMRNHTHLSFFFLSFPFTFTHTLNSKTGLMVARAVALRTNINIDGRPLPPKKRRRTSSKHCAPHRRERERVCVCGGTGILFEEPNPTGSRPRDLIGLYRKWQREKRPQPAERSMVYSRGKPSTCTKGPHPSCFCPPLSPPSE